MGELVWVVEMEWEDQWIQLGNPFDSRDSAWWEVSVWRSKFKVMNDEMFRVIECRGPSPLNLRDDDDWAA